VFFSKSNARHTREEDASLAFEAHERLVGLILAVLEPVTLVAEHQTDLKIKILSFINLTSTYVVLANL